MFAKILNNQIIEYPSNPYSENKNVSFAIDWNGGILNDKEYVRVEDTTQPSIPIGRTIVEQMPIFDGTKWIQVWSVVLLPKDNIKENVSNKRYNVEVGGVRVDGHLYHTDRESQTKYIAIAFELLQANTQTWTINWKTMEDNFVTLNADQMNEVISAVKNHVQTCFNKEAEYYDLIDTADSVTLENTDFSLGWPSNN